MSLWTRIIDGIDGAYERAQAVGDRPRRLGLGLVRALIQLGRQLYHDDCLNTAAALTFTTLLSLVPLMAVSFAVLRAFTSSAEMTGQISEWLLSSFLAESVSEVAQVIGDFLERARSGAVGLVGFIFLMVTAVTLFLSIESAFNRIWRVTQTRPFHRRVTTFYAVITLSPALVGVAIYVTASIQSSLGRVPFGARIVPWLLEAASLTLLYRLLPHTRVQWRAAAIAGVVAAVVFDLTKWGFNHYVSLIYEGSVRAAIYGSFALVPMFFLWVYVVWIIVLMGVELSFIAQNWRLLTDEQFVKRHREQHGERRLPTGYLTARMFIDVAAEFREHGGGVPIEDVARRLEVSMGELQEALEMLQDADLLLQVDDPRAGVEVIPARPLNRVLLRELYQLPSGRGYQPGQLPARGVHRAVEDLLSGTQEALEKSLDVDVESLLSRAEVSLLPG